MKQIIVAMGIFLIIAGCSNIEIKRKCYFDMTPTYPKDSTVCVTTVIEHNLPLCYNGKKACDF